jgi:hypothetical protein
MSSSPSLAFLGGLFLGGISIGFLRGPYLLFLFGLPGILAHELAHYFIAVLTRSSPSLPRLIPSQDGKNRWTLGSVKFQPGVLSGGLVALAPMYVLPPLGRAGLVDGPCLCAAYASRAWVHDGLVGLGSFPLSNRLGRGVEISCGHLAGIGPVGGCFGVETGGF